MKEFYRYDSNKEVDIVTDFINKLENKEIKTILLLDPYFKVEVLSEILSGNSNDIYSKLFYEFIISGVTQIKILLKLDSKKNTLNISRIDSIDFRENFTYHIDIIGEENGSCNISVFYLSDRKKPDLHDRWILFELENYISEVYHIGCTLHSHKGKDITITQVINSNIFQNRFNKLLEKAGEKNKKSN